MTLPILLAAAAPDIITLSPVTLFLQADIVVKIVMAGLLVASIMSWAIIIGFWVSLGRASRRSGAYEAAFWRAGDIEDFYRARGRENALSAHILTAGVTEWHQSTSKRNADLAGTRDRLATAMNGAVATVVDRLADRLNILATIGSVAPFVGLFGTVIGIMTSFQAIAASKNTSLSVVAPGIAEALLATAIGLLAAIPAVIAYNKLSSDANKIAVRMEGFSDEFSAILSRQIDEKVAPKG